MAMLAVGAVLGGCRLRFDPYGDGDCSADELYEVMPTGTGTEDDPIRINDNTNVPIVGNLGLHFAKLFTQFA